MREMEANEGTVSNYAGGNGTHSTKRRWWLHLILLGAYPIALGVLPQFIGSKEATLLPDGTAELLAAMAFELAVFGIIFGAAWYASRANSHQLMLGWHDGARPLVRGFLYSIALRLVIALVLVLFALAAAVAGGMEGIVEKLRPRTEVVVDPGALVTDPVYFWLTITIVSFVVGGLREELWRAGMIAGMRAVFPERWRGISGDIIAISIAAVIFGLGHLPQGWGGAVITALLGLGLGAVILRHRSIWEAVIAHGFFNATSFLLLYYLARTNPELLPGQ